MASMDEAAAAHGQDKSTTTAGGRGARELAVQHDRKREGGILLSAQAQDQRL